jgi:multimeric flavodoxin WrbA
MKKLLVAFLKSHREIHNSSRWFICKKSMKILGILGSPRKKNTYNMLKTVLETADGEHEIIFLKDKNISPCRDCRNCHKNHQCIIKDGMAEIYEKLIKTNCVIFGSPTYFHNVSGIMKNFMDRCLPFYFSRKLESKKAILLTSGNFEDKLRFDKNGKCRWHKEEIVSAKRCLKSMEYFCEVLGLRTIGSIFALHDDWKEKEKQLIKLGKKIKNK